MDFQVSKFEGDRLKIVFFLLYLSKRRNYSSVGFLKCVQFHNWLRIHLIVYQLQNIFFFTHNVSSNDCLALRTWLTNDKFRNFTTNGFVTLKQLNH